MKFLLLYPYPPEPDGQSMQGHYLLHGLRALGEEVMPCDRADSLQKRWAYEYFKPDAAIGVGFWGDVPELVVDPLDHGVQAVPWFNADGWVANYHNILNKLPLLVTTSNWVKSTYARDGVEGDNVQVCPIGFDPAVFYPRPREDPAVLKLKEMLGIKPDEKVIMTIGGDVTSKGAQEMLRAIAKIQDRLPKWKYVFKVWESFSARDHGREERRLIRELGINRNNLIYLSGKYSPEFMALLLNCADVYAGPSRLEGFGMIQLEAMACGKPVISINVGGPKDTIIHNKTGFLVDVDHEIKLDREWVYKHHGFDRKKMIDFPQPKTFAYRANVDQLAEATLKLMTDEALRDEMGRAAAKHALENFHYTVTAKIMRDHVMRKVLKKDPSTGTSLDVSFVPETPLVQDSTVPLPPSVQ